MKIEDVMNLLFGIESEKELEVIVVVFPMEFKEKMKTKQLYELLNSWKMINGIYHDERYRVDLFEKDFWFYFHNTLILRFKKEQLLNNQKQLTTNV